MTEWFLVIILSIGQGGGADTIGPFKTKERCESALQAFRMEYPGNSWNTTLFISRKSKCIKIERGY